MTTQRRDPQVDAVQDAVERRTEDLSVALVELSGLLVESEPLPDVLQRVAELAVAVVPGCDWAGVTLLERGRAVTAAHTDEVVCEVDRQQYEAGDGPCLDAARRRTTNRVDLEAAEQRWPEFTRRARALGVRSFLAAPLVAGGEGVGSLNLYGRSPRAFDALDDALVALFCGQASVALANARAYARAREVGEQLQAALDSRVLVEQAKGVLMCRDGVDAEEAFSRLRRRSQAQNRPLRQVAAEVLDALPARRD